MANNSNCTATKAAAYMREWMDKKAIKKTGADARFLYFTVKNRFGEVETLRVDTHPEGGEMEGGASYNVFSWDGSQVWQWADAMPAGGNE